MLAHENGATSHGAAAMNLDDYPLLNRPALMLTVLKTAARGDVGLDDCLARLRADLARIHEAAPLDTPDVRAELEAVVRELAAARLLAPAGRERFGATGRGRAMLEAHPEGIDESVLVEFPEFREFLARDVRHHPPEDACTARYDEGFAAHEAGESFDDNPHASDSVDHQAWENGWFAARDARPHDHR
jgi:hypothetical protein